MREGAFSLAFLRLSCVACSVSRRALNYNDFVYRNKPAGSEALLVLLG